MRLTVFFLLCLFTLSNCEDESAARKNFRAKMLECAKKHDITQDDIKTMFKEENAEELAKEKNKCFLQCNVKASGVFNEDGSLNLEKNIAMNKLMADQSDHDKVREIAKACVEEANNEELGSCDMAYKLVACQLKLFREKSIKYVRRPQKKE